MTTVCRLSTLFGLDGTISDLRHLIAILWRQIKRPTRTLARLGQYIIVKMKKGILQQLIGVREQVPLESLRHLLLRGVDIVGCFFIAYDKSELQQSLTDLDMKKMHQ